MASVGKAVPIGFAPLRPTAEAELAAYGIDLRGKRVADIGAGKGRLALGAARMARAVVAVEPDRDALAEARANAKREGLHNVTFRGDAAQDLALPSRSFDVVLFSWVL